MGALESRKAGGEGRGKREEREGQEQDEEQEKEKEKEHRQECLCHLGAQMDFQVKAQWTSRLKLVLEAVGKNLEDELDQMAADAVEEARSRAPRLTGAMAASITVGAHRVGGRVKNGSGARKTVKGGGAFDASKSRVLWASFPAAHLEFGTRRILSRPFLVPAVLNQKRKALRRIAREGLV